MRQYLLVFGIVTLAGHPAAAQVPSLHVDSINARLEAVFPAMPLSQSGCRYSGNVSAETGRLYSWEVRTAFSDSWYPMNHIYELSFHFFFPDTVELTEARFDSIAAVTPVWVAELRGEPPNSHNPFRLDHSRVHRSEGRLMLEVKGRQAVDALLQTGSRDVGLAWCEGSEKRHKIRVVPIERH